MRRAATAAALAAALILAAGAARGERAQRGGVIASLDGGITPLRLPRDRRAPVAFHLAGGLRSADGSVLPRVRTLRIDLPAQGAIDTRGLPVCPPRRLRHTTGPGAARACGPALVGHGDAELFVLLEGQAPLVIHARLRLFNSRLGDGRRAILMHAYSISPPIAVVVTFVVHRQAGRFGASLVARLPEPPKPPHLARFDVLLGRTYTAGGRRRSFLSASCPVPPRFTAGFLPIARTTYGLAGGRSLGVEIVRGCRAR